MTMVQLKYMLCHIVIESRKQIRAVNSNIDKQAFTVIYSII